MFICFRFKMSLDERVEFLKKEERKLQKIMKKTIKQTEISNSDESPSSQKNTKEKELDDVLQL